MPGVGRWGSFVTPTYRASSPQPTGLQDSPSLRPRLPELIAARYGNVRKNAMRETGLPLQTFPETCPFSIAQLLDEEFWPQ
ncbi:DUF29 domain-containing protein [uncultured Lamprocystis sp.]|uniref:DUF29 domain-containing protein n=1 Tax=uncultured Lamprocystis sp. TaxID=543132 RepID=UPI0025FF0000|nr:DUF29 domain-containing protein [uncultured Lamprocystis sp.]